MTKSLRMQLKEKVETEMTLKEAANCKSDTILSEDMLCIFSQVQTCIKRTKHCRYTGCSYHWFFFFKVKRRSEKWAINCYCHLCLLALCMSLRKLRMFQRGHKTVPKLPVNNLGKCLGGLGDLSAFMYTRIPGSWCKIINRVENSTSTIGRLR